MQNINREETTVFIIHSQQPTAPSTDCSCANLVLHLGVCFHISMRPHARTAPHNDRDEATDQVGDVSIRVPLSMTSACHWCIVCLPTPTMQFPSQYLFFTSPSADPPRTP